MIIEYVCMVHTSVICFAAEIVTFNLIEWSSTTLVGSASSKYKHHPA